MRNLILTCVLVLLLPAFALAQGGPVVDYSTQEHKFALNLPGGGIISDIYSDPDWVVDESQTAVRWQSRGAGEAVSEMMLSALELGQTATDADIANFIDGYTGSLADSGAAVVDEISDTIQLADRGWVSVLAHTDGADGTIYYEAFITRHNTHVYAVVYFYTVNAQPATDYAHSLLETFEAW